MRRAFNIARKRKVVTTVPIFELLKESNVREGFVERPQFELIAKSLPADLADFAWFGYLTAWRRAEISSLTWGDVDLKAGTIRLRHKHSKNGRPRLVPIAGDLRGLLARRQERRKVTEEDGSISLSAFVFHRGDGKPVGVFRKRWAAACTEAGLPGLLFHDLRRSGIRNMVRAGVPEKIAMEISGHRTRAVFDRYNIVDEDDLRSAVERTHEYTRRRQSAKESGADHA